MISPECFSMMGKYIRQDRGCYLGLLSCLLQACKFFEAIILL